MRRQSVLRRGGSYFGFKVNLPRESFGGVFGGSLRGVEKMGLHLEPDSTEKYRKRKQVCNHFILGVEDFCSCPFLRLVKCSTQKFSFLDIIPFKLPEKGNPGTSCHSPWNFLTFFLNCPPHAKYSHATDGDNVIVGYFISWKGALSQPGSLFQEAICSHRYIRSVQGFVLRAGGGEGGRWLYLLDLAPKGVRGGIP